MKKLTIKPDIDGYEISCITMTGDSDGISLSIGSFHRDGLTLLALTYFDGSRTSQFDVYMYSPDTEITIEFETIEDGRFFDNKYDYFLTPADNRGNLTLAPRLKVPS